VGRPNVIEIHLLCDAAYGKSLSVEVVAIANG
jgi:hypothetical protein